MGLIFIPHANTILADYGKAQFYLKKPTLINKNTTFQTETVPYQNLPINTETPDRYQTVTDPLPPCTITVFNLAFFPFFILLTRATKWCQQCPIAWLTRGVVGEAEPLAGF